MKLFSPQFFTFFPLFFLSVFLLYADTRTENIDIFIVLDKSLSMEEEIEDVKAYVNDFFLKKLLIPGDFLTIIVFYGKAEVLVRQEFRGIEDMKAIGEKIDSIRANGRFTDIGNALDQLKVVMSDFQNSSRRQFILLLTDGKQEAPPQSKYYTPDGSFNHVFLENTKTIQKQGWKVVILGIGTKSAAQELAAQLSASYAEVPDADPRTAAESGETSNQTSAKKGSLKEALEAETKDFLGFIELTSTPRFTEVRQDGTGKLVLLLRSKGYESRKTVGIAAVTFSRNGETHNVLPSPFSIALDPENDAEITIPVKFPPFEKTALQQSGELVFSFTGKDTFVPTVFQVSFEVQANAMWMYYAIGGVAAAAAIITIVFLVLRKNKSKKEQKTTSASRS